VTPDGPKGSRYVVQQGVIALAQVTGLPIIPVTCNTQRGDPAQQHHYAPSDEQQRQFRFALLLNRWQLRRRLDGFRGDFAARRRPATALLHFLAGHSQSDKFQRRFRAPIPLPQR
jgi:hypothetical protein